MAYGRLSSAYPDAQAWTTVYTATTGKYGVVNLSVVNVGEYTSSFRVAIVESGTSTPRVQDIIEYNYALEPKGVMERSGLVLNAGQKIMVYVNNPVYAFNVYGIENDN